MWAFFEYIASLNNFELILGIIGVLMLDIGLILVFYEYLNKKELK